jgi:hypothetical protein
MPPDYSGQNLQERSFKGQNLAEVNFSKADIRGANFTNAILNNANFSGATAGLQRRWVIGLLIVTFLLSLLTARFSIIIAMVIKFESTTDSEKLIAGIVISLAIITPLLAVLKGLIVGGVVFPLVLAFVFALAFVAAGDITQGFILTGSTALSVARMLIFSVAFAVATAARDLAFMLAIQETAIGGSYTQHKFS